MRHLYRIRNQLEDRQQEQEQEQDLHLLENIFQKMRQFDNDMRSHKSTEMPHLPLPPLPLPPALPVALMTSLSFNHLKELISVWS
jgi:hypothetical protein